MLSKIVFDLSGSIFDKPDRVNMNCLVAASNRCSLTDCFSWGCCLPPPPPPFLLLFLPCKTMDDALEWVASGERGAKDWVGCSAANRKAESNPSLMGKFDDTISIFFLSSDFEWDKPIGNEWRLRFRMRSLVLISQLLLLTYPFFLI